MHSLRRVMHWLRKDDRLSWAQHIAMIRQLLAWERAVYRLSIVERPTGNITAYVANYKRPYNIELIVRSLLASPSIERIIVSNNNPHSPLDRWLHISSPRITVLNHAIPQSAAMRFIHLKQFPSPFYLVLDDDIFLSPVQIDALAGFLLSDPSVPHGVFGQRLGESGLLSGLKNINGYIDVLNRVYAFSDKHLHAFFTLSAKTGIADGDERWKQSRWDDLCLSRAGNSSPRIHDVGFIVDCPTEGRKGTATWREETFFSEREVWFRTFRDAQTTLIQQ